MARLAPLRRVHADAQRMLVGIIDGVESWGQFPREKKRLIVGLYKF
jgi:hypothetical protein